MRRKITVKKLQKYAKRGYSVVINNGKVTVEKTVYSDEK